MKNILYFTFALLFLMHLHIPLNAQSYNKNYTVSRIPARPTYSSNDIDALGFENKIVQINYFDGFNRTTQNITMQATDNWNGKDLVHFYQYNNQGKQPISYLPYVANSNNGEFQQNPVQDQNIFYNNSSKISHDGPFYSETKFDNSPLNQVEESSAPGNSWQTGNGHTTSQILSYNDANEIYQWKVNVDVIGRPRGATRMATYAENTLTKLSIVDAQGNISFEYKDKEGHTICKRIQAYTDADNKTYDFTNGTQQINGLGSIKDYCTYYLYDDFGRLTYYLSASALQKLNNQSNSFVDDESLTDIIFKEFISAWHFDKFDRQIEKHVPDASWEYYVYNKTDELIFSQDAVQKSNAKWSFKKYDKLGRAIIQGVFSSSQNREQLQMIADLHQNFSEERDNSSEGYTNVALPINSYEIYQTNFYDDYHFTFNPTLSAHTYQNWGSNESSNRVFGLLTATKTYILGSNGNYLYTINYYDEEARLIQLHTQNYIDYPNSWDIINNEYNFKGEVVLTERNHTAFGNSIYIKTGYNYDHMGKLIDITKKINNDTEIHMVYNEYNELDQLVKKNLHYDWHWPNDYMQHIDYRYNSRGWLTSINNSNLFNDGGLTNEDDNDVFGEELFYDFSDLNNSTFSAIPQYNGNISSVRWRTKTFAPSISYKSRPVHCYAYRYDDFNRLTASYYARNSDVSPFDFDQGVNDFTEKESYNLTDNIQSLTRHSIKGITDDLTYSYANDSYQLISVNDLIATSCVSNDFKDKSAIANEYEYDNNGSITYDANKDLTTTYNYLSLPETINNSSGLNSVVYTYDAAGNKLSKTSGPSGNSITNYYVNGIEYEGGNLMFITTEEGRVRPKATDALNLDSYVYDYMIRDHLDNVRVVITNEIISKNYWATMEDLNSDIERQLFYNIPPTRDNKPPLMPGDTSYTPDQKISALDPAIGTSIGHAKVLEVSSGDELSFQTKYFFSSTPFVQSNAQTVQNILSQLTNILFPGYSLGTLSAEQIAIAQQTFTQNAGLNDYLNNLLNINNNSSTPRAFLTWILLDENFNIVPECSGILQASNPDELGNLAMLNLTIPENGYLYIYVSNETEGKEVDFDNLKIQHIPSYVVEENHYYPYGLLIEPISYCASWRNPINKNKFQDKELQSELDMNMLDFHARHYDAVLGRWVVQDPAHQFMNPYLAMGNNPVRFTDPDGKFIFTALALIAAPFTGGASLALLPFAIGADIGTWQGGSLANGTMNPFKWDYSSSKTWSYMAGGAVVGAASGGAANAVATSGMAGANTAAIYTGSFINATGTSLYTGGQTNGSISIGFASYNLDKNELGYLGKKGNSPLENLGYGLGALANVSDILAGSQTSEAQLNTEHSDNIGHSSLTIRNESDPTHSLVSVGPAPGGKWIFNPFKFKNGTNSWSNYTDKPDKVWTIGVKGVNLERISDYGASLNKGVNYNLYFSSCVNHTARALSISGVPVLGIHPFILHSEMVLRSIGARPMLYSYLLYQH